MPSDQAEKNGRVERRARAMYAPIYTEPPHPHSIRTHRCYNGNERCRQPTRYIASWLFFSGAFVWRCYRSSREYLLTERRRVYSKHFLKILRRLAITHSLDYLYTLFFLSFCFFFLLLLLRGLINWENFCVFRRLMVLDWSEWVECCTRQYKCSRDNDSNCLADRSWKLVIRCILFRCVVLLTRLPLIGEHFSRLLLLSLVVR